jgi:hypothetical protein
VAVFSSRIMNWFPMDVRFPERILIRFKGQLMVLESFLERGIENEA